MNFGELVLVKYLLEFYLKREKITLVNNPSLASLYEVDNYQLAPDIDRAKCWKLDIILNFDGVVIASVSKNSSEILGYWWKKSQRGEKLVVWYDRDLSQNQPIFINARSIVLSNNLQDKDSLKLPELLLSEVNQLKVDYLSYLEILTKFDLRQFSVEIKGFEIDRATYHRVRKYVARMEELLVNLWEENQKT